MEQQETAMDGMEETTSSEMTPVGQEAAAETDLLTALERRWESMSAAIRDLRNANTALREQLRERDEQAARGDQETVRLREQVGELLEEKRRTISRVEGLLARFDESGQ